eukprot:TRINITY_DN3489_c0_g1_i4.p1 TRINITY_DN3489_c0_g1~~TRINITY_DN3489_c0_g1_i4.p1  ORF type:complete len:488 (-),score=46.21 TRINITY_DN3489_c0_g1_i4:4-1467(-)
MHTEISSIKDEQKVLLELNTPFAVSIKNIRGITSNISFTVALTLDYLFVWTHQMKFFKIPMLPNVTPSSLFIVDTKIMILASMKQVILDIYTGHSVKLSCSVADFNQMNEVLLARQFLYTSLIISNISIIEEAISFKFHPCFEPGSWLIRCNPPEGIILPGKHVTIQIGLFMRTIKSLRAKLYFSLDDIQQFIDGLLEAPSDVVSPKHVILDIHQSIGKGAYAEVFSSTMRYHRSATAIKTAAKVFFGTSEDEIKHLLYQETNNLRPLLHPNLVLFLHSINERFIILTEEMSRGSLRKAIHNPELKFDEILIIKISIDISRGMNYLHSQGLIHRDLKSGNVLLDDYWRAVVCDFGTTRPLDLYRTMTPRKGTPLWMAPEVLKGGRYSEKADVYSFGMIIWEMLSRKTPFFEGNAKFDVSDLEDTVINRKKRPQMPLSTSPFLNALINRCWHDSVTKRPHFREIVKLLEHYLNVLQLIKQWGPVTDVQ